MLSSLPVREGKHFFYPTGAAFLFFYFIYFLKSGLILSSYAGTFLILIFNFKKPA
jgi:hypothetical protein